jgi:hypothetical protein
MLSVGMNRKLGKNVGVFNLPARKTCPGATSYCGKICYAMKAERCYKSARDSREKNYQASLGLDFVTNMIAELTKFRTKGDKVRIHESGDFYSQEYLDKWIAIAATFPASIVFLAYTKMYDRLDFSRKPENMIIYASYDPVTAAAIGTAPDGLKECIIVDDASKAPAGWHVCPPVSKNHHNYCGVSCTVCWAGSANAVWIKH